MQRAGEAALYAGHRVTIGILSGSDAEVIENGDGAVVTDSTP